MKIKSGKTERSSTEEVLEILKEDNLTFPIEIAGELFVYKPLSVGEYKKIYNNGILTEEDKKDEICKKCLLYPKDFDFDNCLAGIPDTLADDIIEKSKFDDKSIASLIKSERINIEYDISDQISCIISEAFPTYKIEEIESWDMYKFLKYFVKAEWKLKILRSLTFEKDIVDVIEGALEEEEKEDNPQEQYHEPQNEYNEQPVKETREQARQKPTNNKNKNNAKGMSEQAYKEYLEFAKKFPDIDMEADAAFTGSDTMTADTLPPALRPGWG